MRVGLLAFSFAAPWLLAGIMFAAYRVFRHGEQYEYRQAAPKTIPGLGISYEMVKQVKDQEIPGLGNPFEMITQAEDVEEWISRLN